MYYTDVPLNNGVGISLYFCYYYSTTIATAITSIVAIIDAVSNFTAFSLPFIVHSPYSIVHNKAACGAMSAHGRLQPAVGECWTDANPGRE